MSLLPQFGFLELLLVAAIALVVVGPKDLPRLMRAAGKALGQARRMAEEFTSAFDQMAREAEMEDMRREIEKLKNDNPVADVKKEFDGAMKPARDAFRTEVDGINEAAAPKEAATPQETDAKDGNAKDGDTEDRDPEDGPPDIVDARPDESVTPEGVTGDKIAEEDVSDEDRTAAPAAAAAAPAPVERCPPK